MPHWRREASARAFSIWARQYRELTEYGARSVFSRCWIGIIQQV